MAFIIHGGRGRGGGGTPYAHQDMQCMVNRKTYFDHCMLNSDQGISSFILVFLLAFSGPTCPP
jgi:hypothetical protein